MKLYKMFTPREFFAGWKKYWFSGEPVIGLSLFRIALGFSALLMHIPRFPYIKELYTDIGFVWPLQLAPSLNVIFPLSPAVAYFVNVLLLLSAVAIVFGYRTRTAAAIFFITHTYLVLLENFSAYSITTIVSIYSLFLIFSNAGDFFSLDAKLKTDRWAPEPVPQATCTIRQLMIWQVALAYIGNAVHKIMFGFDTWLSGNTIIWALQDQEWGQLWGPLFVEYFEGPFRVLIGVGFILYLGLGLAILFRRTRIWAIVFGLGWHWVNLFFTVISPAWLVWMSIYILLIEPKTWEKQWQLLKNGLLPKWKLVLFIAFIVFMIYSAFHGRFFLAT